MNDPRKRNRKRIRAKLCPVKTPKQKKAMKRTR